MWRCDVIRDIFFQKSVFFSPTTQNHELLYVVGVKQIVQRGRHPTTVVQLHIWRQREEGVGERVAEVLLACRARVGRCTSEEQRKVGSSIQERGKQLGELRLKT